MGAVRVLARVSGGEGGDKEVWSANGASLDLLEPQLDSVLAKCEYNY